MSLHMCILSLSTLVLNSRDWSEIVWLPETSRFKINLAISFIRKIPAGMHWLGYNDAVSLLTKRKLEYFSLQPILKISKSACILSACQPAVRPGSARCRAPEISQEKGNRGGFTKPSFRLTIFHCAMVIPLLFVSLLSSSIGV